MPCPAFVRYRYPIEITPQIFYFSRETAVQESLMAPFLAKNRDKNMGILAQSISIFVSHLTCTLAQYSALLISSSR